MLIVAMGCVPNSTDEMDEKREAHYMAGVARARALDYDGAIQEFEKALEVNPKNASAHFELAWLYEKDERDLVGAIYHYDRYLRLRPNAPNADAVRARLQRCKQLLASTVMPVSTAPTLQREIERLTAENAELKRQLDSLRAYIQSYAMTITQTVSTPTQPTTSTRQPPTHEFSPQRSGSDPRQPPSAPQQPQIQQHTVQRGETLYIIARKYGVTVDALMQANPGINPRRLQVGQTIKVPLR